MVQDAHVIPARRPDLGPSIGVASELPFVFRVDSSVVLDGDLPSRVGQVDLGDEVPPLVEDVGVDVGSGKTIPGEQESQTRLPRRTNARMSEIRCSTEDATSDIAHLTNLRTEVLHRRGRHLSADERIRGGHQVVQRP